jgi:hypothetical protein
MSAAEALAQRPASPASGASTRDSHATAAAPTAPAGEKGEQLYVPPVKDEEPKTAFGRFTHRLSNLPEWPISKNGKISGRALNLAIGVACSSGFLAFGESSSASFTLHMLTTPRRLRPGRVCTTGAASASLTRARRCHVRPAHARRLSAGHPAHDAVHPVER